MRRSPEYEKIREERWQTTFIPCKYHPERRCEKYGYVSQRCRRCNWCVAHRRDGSRRPSQVKSDATRNLKTQRNRHMWARTLGFDPQTGKPFFQ